MAPGRPAAAVTAQPGTPLQIAEMLAGGIAAEQAGKLALAAGFSALQVAESMHIIREAGESHEPDVRSPEVKELDTRFPVAKPEDYLISYFRPGEHAMTPELKQSESTARAWLSGTESPRELGNSLVSQISRVAQQTQHLSPDELITFGESEYVKLQRAHGEAWRRNLSWRGKWSRRSSKQIPA